MRKMLSLFVISLFFTGQVSAQLNSIQGGQVTAMPFICSDVDLPDPPFFISDEYKQGDKVWENFRNIDNQNLSDKYIPRGSIVYTPPSLYEKMSDSDRRIPVRVLSLPNKETEDRLKQSQNRPGDGIKTMISTVKNKARAEMNSQGWIDKKSVRKAGEFTFFVTKDAPLYKSPGGISLNKNPISLSMTEDGKYKAKRCCTPDSYPGEKKCLDQYKFVVSDKDTHQEEEFVVTNLECSLIENMAPVANRIVEPVKTILDLMRVENPELAIDQLELLPARQRWSNGKPTVSRKEMLKVKIDDETGEGPFGSFHYRPDDKVSSDIYMKPTSHCAFLQVVKKHNESCKEAGCQVQFGNMYHPPSWGTHDGHGTGECVDIRPFRKSDDDNAGLVYSNNANSRYDREKTKSFIQLLKKSGARTNIFNDRQISGLSRDSSGVHDDHIHVCFGENREKVQQTCRNGLGVD